MLSMLLNSFFFSFDKTLIAVFNLQIFSSLLLQYSLYMLCEIFFITVFVPRGCNPFGQHTLSMPRVIHIHSSFHILNPIVRFVTYFGIKSVNCGPIHRLQFLMLTKMGMGMILFMTPVYQLANQCYNKYL